MRSMIDVAYIDLETAIKDLDDLWNLDDGEGPEADALRDKIKGITRLIIKTKFAAMYKKDREKIWANEPGAMRAIERQHIAMRSNFNVNKCKSPIFCSKAENKCDTCMSINDRCSSEPFDRFCGIKYGKCNLCLAKAN